jgi:hypothetical protein
MGRVFFPTASLNRFGVRETDQRATLGAIIQRFPAEPTPRAAMTPTAPILGAVGLTSKMIRAPYDGGIVRWPPIYYQPPVRTPMNPTVTSPPVSSSGGGGTAPTPATPVSATPAPVSSQVSPTPTVTVPPQAPTGAVLVSSGGGTQTPATATVVAPAPSSGFVEGVAAWLGGSTTLFNYAVPNAVIAGIVVLGFAFLSSSSTGKKR